jgi:DNA-binding transcriptional regulator YiaG
MANLAIALKAEISRIARKEIRAEVEPLKKAVSNYRSEIAGLKRRAAESEQALKRVMRANAKPVAPQVEEETGGRKIRFSANGLKAQRKRLGLSAEEVGLLVGASGQSVYNWEGGSARPRQKHLAAIAILKTMGKKSAAAKLDELRPRGTTSSQDKGL